VIHAPVFGGAHNQVLQLQGPLASLGIEAVAVLPADATEAAERLRVAGIEVELMELGRLRASPDPKLQAKFITGWRRDINGLRALIKRRDIDVVQVHGVTNPQGALAARRGDAAVVWQLFDTRAPMLARRALAPIVVRLADAMTVWGEGLIAAHPGTERLGPRIVPVYPPVDTSHFAPDPGRRARARERLGVGTVGVVNPQKGHGGLIDAAAILARSYPRLQTRIVGASSPAHADYEAELRRAINRLGLDDRVSFIDPGPDVRDLVVGFDVFAMPSVPRSEGMPTAILEAMASGIPVVATRVGAVDELVQDGATGRVVEPENADALANALAVLLSDEALRASMSAQARHQAETKFDLADLAKRHASAYRLAIEHRDGRRARVRGRGPDEAEMHDRERSFFDAGAEELDPAAMPPREYEPYESRFEDALIESAGPLAGKHVLDLGCGTGDLTLRMLQRGARVTALDISPGAVGVAEERARRFVPEGDARFVIGTAEATGLDNHEFDAVVGKLVLHHLNLRLAAPEIHRVLKPGGRGAFIETSGLNPLLRAARRHLPGRAGIARYGTPDEHPLTQADVELMRSHFRRVDLDFPVLVLMYLFERHVLRWRIAGTDRVLAGADRRLARSPRLRRLSYYLRLTLEP
jgi:glycosyltransferase involved in cell wall biosynthesis/SAM-dependent methyltransferase